jgi:hypothetical protein
MESGNALCARGTTIEIREDVRSGDPESPTSTEQPKRWTFATGSSHRSSSRRRWRHSGFGEHAILALAALQRVPAAMQAWHERSCSTRAS